MSAENYVVNVIQIESLILDNNDLEVRAKIKIIQKIN